MDSLVLRGSCLCSNVTYTSSTLPSSFSLCHCQSCRRSTGSAFGAWIDLPRSSLHIKTSGPLLSRRTTLAVRLSCQKCGTPLAMVYHAIPDTISVAAGTVDDSSVVGELPEPTNHIFVAEKAPWFTIPNDGLKRYDRFPDSVQEAINVWTKDRF